MTKKKRFEQAKEEHRRLGKRIAQTRFELVHAGDGSAGAPKKPMTVRRRAEVTRKLKTLEKTRAEVALVMNENRPAPKLPKVLKAKPRGATKAVAAAEAITAAAAMA